MMPHPERAADPLIGSADGRGLFESMLARVGA
jgi:phosphoribosylformylglycinamidine (FGAM) synthase-like amidotransferase family enzyme